MRLLLAGLLSPVCLLAAIDGRVMNATTGGVQPKVSVNLVQPGAGGMQTLGTATSDDLGKFHFDKEPPPGPALLQGTYKDVVYTLVLAPGTPTTGLQMSVFDTTSNAASNKMAQHIFLFEPGDTELRVSETFLMENNTDATFQDPVKGSVQVYIPGGDPKDLSATVEGAAGMSVRRPLEKTTQPGVYKLAYAIKPGESRIDVGYTIPLAPKYTWKVMRTDGPTRIATPVSVTLSGAGLQDLGQEPQTQARIYAVVDKATVFEANIKGSGSLHRGEETQQSKEDDGSPQPEVADARIYTRLPWVLGLVFGILALGGTYLFRKGAV